mmetsp:Transcript_103490/g.194721  ORF Transcript_103490/g.194721 Transcript_103490/m.194721 type:complete len:114 (-) Transcript_103490:212-553(-)
MSIASSRTSSPVTLQCEMGVQTDSSQFHDKALQNGAYSTSPPVTTVEATKHDVQFPSYQAMPRFSVGTLGHPLTCAAPCKFANRQRGCKDGDLCTRCHLCWWTRKCAKTSEQT